MRIIFLFVGLLFALPSMASEISSRTFVKIVVCESGGRNDAVGDDGVSVGILQFQEKTFDWLATKHRDDLVKDKVVPRGTKLKWKNPVHQLLLGQWAMSHGYGNLWTCYRKLGRSG